MKKIKYLLLIVVGAFLLTGCALKNNGFSVRNTTWYARDNSEMIFGDHGEFAWYLKETDHTDNYYKGNYKLYVGKNAYNHITKDLTQYGVTADELDGLIARNKDYSMDKLVVFDITYSAYRLYGVDKSVAGTDTAWYGMLLKDGTYLDLANMRTASTMGFTKKSI